MTLLVKCSTHAGSLRPNPLNVKFLAWQLRDLSFCRWNRNRVFLRIIPPIGPIPLGAIGPPGAQGQQGPCKHCIIS